MSYIPFSLKTLGNSKLSLQLIKNNAWDFLVFETVLYSFPCQTCHSILMHCFHDSCVLALLRLTVLIDLFPIAPLNSVGERERVKTVAFLRSVTVQKYEMEKSRNEQFISFQFHAALRSMMKFWLPCSNPEKWIISLSSVLTVYAHLPMCHLVVTWVVRSAVAEL